ncbi:hypothetical protein M2480_000609 [Parabacteroides sp. PFB2-12]|uniref:alginate lyase family protein n=1 Tax=unclassified Parabacteroides TaxID=2649774 RepID=UPI0024751CEC|nr:MULTISPECIES: alginate lyase family protein [unclassified Parabacteroides]MDH6341946.1 hypothetical protein [Parabacteroides sp. PM6-13]MDH6389644.1 hypothetical protein [Parabacteroides sp. PFB2-12]
MISRKILFLFVLLGIISGAFAQQFIHPGLLHSEESLERIKLLVDKKSQPAYGSYEILTKLPEARSDYSMGGPFEIISRDGKYSYTKGPSEHDFNAAYYNALLWQITGHKAHADKSMEIIRAYAATLREIPPTNDAPLCAGLQGFMLVNAAEIMRYTYQAPHCSGGWNEQDTEAVEAMFRKVFLPVLNKFFQTKPYTNGNWGIAVAKAKLSFGVFLNDRALYNEAIDFFYHGKDNGSLPNYIAESGQSQEAGRDQQHVMLGVACFADMAEVAWTQGNDLYGALDNRIMKGYEYMAKSNLGYEVPFVTWKDITGKYSHLSTFGKDGMGRFRSVFEIAYNHYVVRKGLEMPYTKIVLGLVRPEGAGFTCDNTGFGSLLYYLGEDLNAGKEKDRIEEDLTQLKAWTFSTGAYRAVNGVMSFVSSGIKLQKRISYDPSTYPNIVVKAPAIPTTANKKWLTLSYSIQAAPEFWELDSDKATKIGEDLYVFKITDFQSNNGAPFSIRPTNVTLILNFGDTCGSPVVVEWVRSYTDAEILSLRANE